MKGGKSKAESKKADRLAVKGGRKTKKEKAPKDPNKPKRPPSAFLVFMEGFRVQFKENNPASKGVAAVGKAGGDRWRSMSDDEKAPFVAQAEQRKRDYEKKIDSYNKKLVAGGNDEEEESDKSKSEINDGEGSEQEEQDD